MDNRKICKRRVLLARALADRFPAALFRVQLLSCDPFLFLSRQDGFSPSQMSDRRCRLQFRCRVYCRFGPRVMEHKDLGIEVDIMKSILNTVNNESMPLSTATNWRPVSQHLRSFVLLSVTILLVVARIIIEDEA